MGLTTKRTITEEEHFYIFLSEINHVIDSLENVNPIDSSGMFILKQLYVDYKRSYSIERLIE